MSKTEIIGKAEAWKHNADGSFTMAYVIVNVTNDGKEQDEVEIGFQLGERRQQCYLTVNAEELVLAVMRARSTK